MHEAGHALMAFLCHRPLTFVTIVPGEKGNGRTCYASRETDRKESAATEELIKISLAGRAAEKAITGRWNLVGIAHDWPLADELARLFLAEEQVVDYLRQLEVIVAELLEQPLHRAALIALVKVLIVKETLDGPEAEHVIREARQLSEGTAT